MHRTFSYTRRKGQLSRTVGWCAAAIRTNVMDSHCDCKQRTYVPTWTWNCAVKRKFAKLILVEGWIKACRWDANLLNEDESNSQSTRRSHSTITDRKTTVNEFERQQSVGEYVSQKYLAKWGFKNCSSPPCQASLLCIDYARIDHMLMTNTSSIQTECGNRRECIHNLKRPSSLRPAHAQRVNVSSKMRKEMGIRIFARYMKSFRMKR